MSNLVSFKAAKGNFFDREAVTKGLDAAARRVLSKFGAFVRQRSRTSIRKKKGTSPPAGPPYSHVGTLRKLIFFGYDREKKAVVVGPVLSDRPTGAPENLEHGGTADIPQPGGRAVRATIRPRPFMGPALAAELPKLTPMWRDSVR